MFVEVTRLLIVLASTAAGYTVGGGDVSSASGRGPVLGAILGALIGYVVGGIGGRLLESALGKAERRLESTPAPKLLSAGLGAIVTGGIGAILAAPAPVFIPHRLGWPIFALVTWVAGYAGFFFGFHRSDDFLATVGLSTRPFTRTSPYSHQLGNEASLLDTSAIIDGRLLALAKAGLLSGTLLVPVFVLDELQGIADAQDPMRRRRGRRGLDLLKSLQTIQGIEVRIVDDEVLEHAEVDAKLISLAKRLRVGLVTVDIPLQRVAELQDVHCLNLDDLTESLKAVYVPAEMIDIHISKEGREPGQGVGYLDDGTMVVVAEAAELIGSEVHARIVNTMQTSVGKMLFASLEEGA